MDLAVFRQLLSPLGQEALRTALASPRCEADFLSHFQTLCRRFPPELARAALETAILRGEAVAKFPAAERMYFTRQALEQASSQAVAAYRAGRYRPFERVADLGCSIGGDTLALAAVAPTLALDRDPLRLAMAQANLWAVGGQAAAEGVLFVQADLLAPLPLSAAPPQSALFFDPARRAEHRRLFSVRQYQPPLDIVHEWRRRFAALGVKISPGVDLAELSSYDCEVEFISLRGELKEAVLWFGPLKTAVRRATLLPGAHTLVSPPDEPAVALAEPRAWLYEPDPAILRAGLVKTLAAQLDAAQLDPQIAYLTADTLTPTPLARAWAVEDWFPFGLKRLRAYLRQRAIGRVVVKKRGSPLEPDALIHALRLSGEQERTLVLTQLRGKPIVVICR